MSFIRLYV